MNLTFELEGQHILFTIVDYVGETFKTNATVFNLSCKTPNTKTETSKLHNKMHTIIQKRVQWFDYLKLSIEIQTVIVTSIVIENL